MSGWTAQDVVAAVWEELGDVECWESEGFHPEGVVRRTRELLVLFRWRRDPHPYAFPVPMWPWQRHFDVTEVG